MKRVILGFLLVVLFGCTKNAPIVNNTKDVLVINKENEILQPIVYSNKTSYELRKAQTFVDIDSIRTILGTRKMGRWNGDNNIGFVYVDMNNDGREDIYYPIQSNDSNIKVKPQVYVNTINGYKLDNSMLPDEYNGALDTRKSIVADFNNDGLPDIFSSNCGYDGYNIRDTPVLFLSNKSTHKYTLAVLPNEIISAGGFHGVSAGDLNGDNNIDMVLVGQGKPRILYGNGDGTFRHTYVNIANDRAFLTVEIIDVNKDGKNDIVMAGNEMWTPSQILWNGDASNITIIADYKIKWGNVMDIVCEDFDGDGINEILLNRTGDETGLWYRGYWLSLYKTDTLYSKYKDITDMCISNQMNQSTMDNGWIPQIAFKKGSDGINRLYAKVQSYPKFYKIWKQNITTKIYE
jgi:hypothetical protein